MNPFRPPRGGPARIPLLAAARDVSEGSSAEIRLFDPIDSWGGEWGISAKEFAATLDSLPDDTSEIKVLINSPGGEVFEAIAIMNMLRAHPAKVTAVVMGIAASAASFIAASADELVMMKNSELLIHNAWGLAVGDANDMRETADQLEHLSRNFAEVYASRSGDTADEWLAVMAKDTLFSADEAVARGLADRVEGEVDIDVAKARFDLSMFARWRDPQARSQELPSSSEPGQPKSEETLTMSDAFIAGVRERLGVTDAEASEETVLSALSVALTAKENTVPEGAVMIDAGILASIRADGEAGRAALEALASARREGIVSAAVREGRISNANRDKWLASLTRDEEGAVDLLASLEPNRIPVVEIGHQDDIESGSERALLRSAGWADDEEEA
jgi:ATP-dependent Clp endopeptidase proteolytic subunit ClpP